MSSISATSSDIVPYDFEAQQVRVIDQDGQPWFSLADVCAVLDIVNVGGAAARLDDDEKGSIRIADRTSSGGNPNQTIINESGLFKLILRSRKVSAKRFTKWVTSEVLPTIRRTGGYGGPAAQIDLNDPATLQQLLLDHTGRALAREERVAELEPKADAFDQLADASGSLCVTDAAKALGVPPRRLFAWLEANHWTYRRTDGGHWAAFQAQLNAGRVEHKGMRIPVRGRPDKLVQQVLITPKGLARLAELKAGK